MDPRGIFNAIYKFLTFTPETYVPSSGTAPWQSMTPLHGLELIQPGYRNNTIVQAGLNWIQRTFTEAPLIVEEWIEAQEEWQKQTIADVLALIERPNPFYSSSTLWKATIADRILNGTAYWMKVYSDTGMPVQLWWTPESTITPIPGAQVGKPGVFIDHYEYRPGFGNKIDIPVGQLIRFPNGMDPDNPVKGWSPLKTAIKEVYIDEEASTMMATLLKNMGIPGVIISPKEGTIPAAAGRQIKRRFLENFGAEHRGEPMVMEGQTEVSQFGFTPEQLQMRSLRAIPEERITAIIGIPVAVVGLGAGLQTTKVGATLREYREEAFQSTIIPMYRDLSLDLKWQLLNEFYPEADFWRWNIGFDMSKIRVLQDDELKMAEGLSKQLLSGGIKRSEFRRRLGYIADPEDELYYVPTNMTAVPVGETPSEPGPAEPSTPAPTPSTTEDKRITTVQAEVPSINLTVPPQEIDLIPIADAIAEMNRKHDEGLKELHKAVSSLQDTVSSPRVEEFSFVRDGQNLLEKVEKTVKVANNRNGRH